MALSWELEDWLTDEGDRVITKMAAGKTRSLTSQERLIYEVWLFDTETRNGGVSQYFENQGMKQWRRLQSAAQNMKLPSLDAFAREVDNVVGESPDAYSACLAASPPLENVYWSKYQTKIIEELRSAVS